MRRMYSEQELTKAIKSVVEQEISDGALDSIVSDAVDDYLVEHPVDITALEGQTIAPANINATGTITAQKLSQSVPNYTQDFYLYTGAGWELTTKYQKFEVINGVLYIISNLVVKNISGSSATASNNLASATLTGINSQIADNLYDIDGNKVSDALSGQRFIAVTSAYFSKYNTDASAPVSGYMRIVNSATANAIAIYIDAPTLSVNADESVYITCRIALTLL